MTENLKWAEDFIPGELYKIYAQTTCEEPLIGEEEARWMTTDESMDIFVNSWPIFVLSENTHKIMMYLGTFASSNIVFLKFLEGDFVWYIDTTSKVVYEPICDT